MISRFYYFSSVVYPWLLMIYPPAYKKRFAGEMIQVFRLMSRDSYQRDGILGITGLWLAVLWDWISTAAYQWAVIIFSLRRQGMANELDHQFGDFVWAISTGLLAGYNLRQVFEALSIEAPEPTASALKLLLIELDKGVPEMIALSNWQQVMLSAPLTRLVSVINLQRQEGGNLAELLVPLSEDLLAEYGSDPAFYEPMRREAAQLGASIPDRISNSKQ